MSEIITAITQLFGQVVFWATVAPWEQAIRVRAGKRVRRLAPGLHLRVPIIDTVHKQSVRLRSCCIQTQTISSADSATLICGATLAYSISDIERLYRGLHHAEDTVSQIVAAEIAGHVSHVARADLAPATVSDAVTARVAPRLAEYGLSDVSVRVTDFAFVRTYRLVSDQRWSGHGEPLSTKGA